MAHFAIIGIFLLQIFYGGYQVFFNSEVIGPLWGTEVDMDLFFRRRLYAIETWIAISGLAIYLAIIYKDKIVKSPE